MDRVGGFLENGGGIEEGVSLVQDWRWSWELCIEFKRGVGYSIVFLS